MDSVEKHVEAYNARDLDVSTTTVAVGTR